MYQFRVDSFGKMPLLQRLVDAAFIPLDVSNRDCAQFLVDWKSGVEVLNADGSSAPYSAAAARALGLPGD